MIRNNNNKTNDSSTFNGRCHWTKGRPWKKPLEIAHLVHGGQLVSQGGAVSASERHCSCSQQAHRSSLQVTKEARWDAGNGFLQEAENLFDGSTGSSRTERKSSRRRGIKVKWCRAPRKKTTLNLRQQKQSISQTKPTLKWVLSLTVGTKRELPHRATGRWPS